MIVISFFRSQARVNATTATNHFSQIPFSSKLHQLILRLTSVLCRLFHPLNVCNGLRHRKASIFTAFHQARYLSCEGHTPYGGRTGFVVRHMCCTLAPVLRSHQVSVCVCVHKCTEESGQLVKTDTQMRAPMPDASSRHRTCKRMRQGHPDARVVAEPVGSCSTRCFAFFYDHIRELGPTRSTRHRQQHRPSMTRQIFT